MGLPHVGHLSTISAIISHLYLLFDRCRAFRSILRGDLLEFASTIHILPIRFITFFAMTKFLATVVKYGVFTTSTNFLGHIERHLNSSPRL